MILVLRKAWAAASMISQLSVDSATFSLSCLMPVPPVLVGPFLSITLSHSLFEASPSGSSAISSLITSNSPLKRGSLDMSILYLSILRRSRLTPGTVSTSPSYLAVDDDRAVDGGALQGLAQGVEVGLQGGGRVADGDPHVDEAGVLLLEALDDKGEGGELLDLNLGLLLVDVDNLDLAVVALGLALDNAEELLLVLLDGLPGHVAELGVLANLVGRAGADGVAVDVDNWLLAHVEPDNLVGLGIDVAADLLDGGVEAGEGGLAAQVDLVAGHAPEVRHAVNLLRQLLDLFEMVLHGRGLPDLGVLSHRVSCVVVPLPI